MGAVGAGPEPDFDDFSMLRILLISDSKKSGGGFVRFAVKKRDKRLMIFSTLMTVLVN